MTGLWASRFATTIVVAGASLITGSGCTPPPVEERSPSPPPVGTGGGGMGPAAAPAGNPFFGLSQGMYAQLAMLVLSVASAGAHAYSLDTNGEPRPRPVEPGDLTDSAESVRTTARAEQSPLKHVDVALAPHPDGHLHAHVHCELASPEGDRRHEFREASIEQDESGRRRLRWIAAPCANPPASPASPASPVD